MNRGIEDRLERIVKFENAKKEKAHRAEMKRQEERARKLKGEPFKLSTGNRARNTTTTKLINFYGSLNPPFNKPMSNLAYERMLYGHQHSFTFDAGKPGLLYNAKMDHFRTIEKTKLVHPRPFILYTKESGKKTLTKSFSTFSSTLPSNLLLSGQEE